MLIVCPLNLHIFYFSVLEQKNEQFHPLVQKLNNNKINNKITKHSKNKRVSIKLIYVIMALFIYYYLYLPLQL